MKIVMLGQKGLPARSGGIERHVESLAKGMVERGHQVIVFGRRWYVGEMTAPHGIEQRFSPGIHTKHLDAITHSFTALWQSRALHPDILHIHGVGIALLAPLARLLLPRTKLVVTFHCMDRRFSKWGWFARTMFHLGEWLTCWFAHEVITVSQELAQYCATEYGRRAHYISHAFAQETAQVKNLSEREATVSSLGLTPYRYFLFVGRLLPHKGAHRLLEAFTWAKARYPVAFSDASVALVGGASFTDAYAQEVLRQAEGIEGVRVLGERFEHELTSLQSCALAHVFPTTEEGLSLAVLEAAHSGRPVISHQLPANEEATGGHAFSLDACSVEALGMGLYHLLTLPESERQAQGKALQGYVAYAYSAQANTDRLDRLYRSLVVGDEALVTSLPGSAYKMAA